MERFDITIQMLGVEASGPQYVWEKVPAEEGELVLYTDAQATIAALRARVDEQIRTWWTLRGVETPCEKCGGAGWRAYASTATWRSGIGGQAITNDVCDRCWGSGDICRKGADLRNMESQLTQRTAELEAAKRERDSFVQRCEELSEIHCDLHEKNKHLQAELERVRADNKALDKWRADVTVSLQRPEGAFFVDVPQHIKDLVKERDELRTLVLALPVVEGQWTVSCAMADRVVEGGIVSDISEAVAAIVQHRQGMEG